MPVSDSASRAPIAVICPMDCEYSLLAQTLEDSSRQLIGDFEFTSGTLDGYPVLAVKCLVGIINATAAVTITLERFHPVCVFTQGTSGGHNPALHRYDLVLGEYLREHGNYITPHRDAGAGTKAEDWIFPGVEVLRDGRLIHVQRFQSDERLLRIAESVPYTRGRRQRGTIASADAWNREIDRINFCHTVLGTDCEEMESFAIARVCAAFGVPVLAFRIISNSELYPEEKFRPDAAVECLKYCIAVLRALIAADPERVLSREAPPAAP